MWVLYDLVLYKGNQINWAVSTVRYMISYYMQRLGDKLLYIAWYSGNLPYGCVDPVVTGRCDYSGDGKNMVFNQCL